MRYLLSIASAIVLFTACERAYTPKPAAYPRVDFPEKSYRVFDAEGCPFSFKVPEYAKVSVDDTRVSEPCWYNIEVPSLKAKVHLSYKPVSSFGNLASMAEDARTFAYKHTIKAEDIIDSMFILPHAQGVLFDIQGNTASSLQFYATDTAKHYLRGSLYFNAPPNKDSLAPVINFFRTDLDTLIRSLRWK